MTDPRIQAILEQLDALVLILLRPVVQRQLLAFFLVALVAWLIPVLFRFLVSRSARWLGVADKSEQATSSQRGSWRRWLIRGARAVEFVLFPAFGLLLGQVAVNHFQRMGWRYGLLERLLLLFWLLLAYRVTGAVLYATLDEETATRYKYRFVTPIFAILFAFSLTFGLTGAFPIGGIELFEFLGAPLTLGSIATSVAVFYIFIALAWITRDVLDHYVLPHTQADPGVSHTILVSTNYAIIAIGVLAALSTLGLDLSALIIIFGGLSVGIGFGLQELVANFVSGILLLFEQTIRPGDVVEVGGQRGTVSMLRMRATVLRSIDNIEVFVPNKTLLTSTVAAYTHTDRTVRRIVRVGVSYGSDPTQVRDILLNIAQNHGLVLKDPAPAVFFTGFGDSSLLFELAVWTDDPLRALTIVSDLHFMIFSDFAKYGIEIPFPQRDLHLRSSDVSLDSMHEQNGASVESETRSVTAVETT